MRGQSLQENAPSSLIFAKMYKNRTSCSELRRLTLATMKLHDRTLEHEKCRRKRGGEKLQDNEFPMILINLVKKKIELNRFVSFESISYLTTII